jgi:hypothetical protein
MERGLRVWYFAATRLEPVIQIPPEIDLLFYYTSDGRGVSRRDPHQTCKRWRIGVLRCRMEAVGHWSYATSDDRPDIFWLPDLVFTVMSVATEPGQAHSDCRADRLGD